MDAPLRSIVSIEDLSNDEILAIFRLAQDIQTEPTKYQDKMRGVILATLFYEASTRTRLSFESAMQRAGGSVISAWDMSATSVVKGESLEDTCRVVSGYADVIVLRHPAEGAAQAVADLVDIPLINAGDGGHEHPTQTLCDLYTIWQIHDQIEGIRVALCGDLKFGRTIHSLVYGLVRFGATVGLLPGKGQELPAHVWRKLQTDYEIDSPPIGKLMNPDALLALYPGGKPSHLENGYPDIIYMTPSQPHQSTIHPANGVMHADGVTLPDGVNWDHLYFTRAQQERYAGDEVDTSSNPRVNLEVMSMPGFQNTSILHPLPRLGEISREVDDDDRSLYFQQAANGVPVRMALLLALLQRNGILTADNDESRPGETHVVHANVGGSTCKNQACIASDKDWPQPRFCVVPGSDSYWLRCYYCDFDFEVAVYANTVSRKYHSVSQLAREQPPYDHTVFYQSAEDAAKEGFQPISNRTRRAPSSATRWPPLKPERTGA